MLELIALGLVAACLSSNSDSKKNKKAEARERRAREEYERKQRKYYEDLGYYEHHYGQGHP